MNSLVILKEMANVNHGLILTRDAVAHGVSRASLSLLCKEGKISRIAVGQYVLSEESADEMLSLGVRSRYIIFSHESALYLHGMLYGGPDGTSCGGPRGTPPRHSVTIPTSKTLSRCVNRQCKIYCIKDELHELGRVRLLTARGNLVWTYDKERTICDIVRSRNRIEDEVFCFALEQYAASGDKDFEKLDAYAREMGIVTAVTRILSCLRKGR